MGTDPELFHNMSGKRERNTNFKAAEFFSEMAKEALVGSFVAERLNLKIGDRFQPYHGLNFKEDTQHEDVMLSWACLKQERQVIR